MAECSTESENYTGAAHNMGNGRGQSGPWQTEYNSNEVLDNYNAAQAREITEATLETVAMSNAPTGEFATSGDIRSANAISRQLLPVYESAQEGKKARIEASDRAITAINGLNTGDVGLWYNIINKMSTWFADARARFDKWVMMEAQNPELQPYQQLLTRQKNQMYTDIAGHQNVYARERQKLVDDLVPISKKTTYSIEEIAHDWSMYGICEHIPEANTELIKRWNESIDNLQKEYDFYVSKGMTPETNARMRQIDAQKATLIKQVNELTANLDSTERPRRLVSAGFTNGEARIWQQGILDKYKVDAPTVEAWTDKLRQAFQFLHNERAKNGTLTPEQINSFPQEFKKWLPLYSAEQNLDGAINDAGVYNPGKYHAREGMADMRPDSAWNSLKYYGNRTALELGMRDFSLSLAHMARRAKNEGRATKNTPEDAGIRSVSYDELWRWRRHGSMEESRKAEKILNSGGIVADVPITDKSGRQILERRYIYFDSAYNKNGITGDMLNDALSSNYRANSKLVDMLGTLSGWHGQLFTRFSPFFAPIGGFRDGLERVFHMMNRTYYTEDGRTLKGMDVIGAYTRNSARIARMLFEAMNGRAESGSVAAQMWDEFQRHGVFQKFIPGGKRGDYSIDQIFNPPTTRVEDIAAKLNLDEPMRKYLNTLGRGKDTVLRKLDGWNDYLQNLGSFNQYVTLREKGLSPAQASQATLGLINMRQHGTLTPYLRIAAPFVVPTVQSAAALGRTLGFGAKNAGDIFRQGRNGWLGVIGGAMAFGALYQVAREAMGYDENGKSYFDNMKFRDLVGYLPIPTDDNNGSFYKMPNGFGPPRIAAALALGIDRVSRGLMEPEDFGVELMLTVAKDVVPTSLPQYSFTSKPAQFIAQLVTPDIIKPFMEVATNTNYFGSDIANERRGDKSRADSGRTSTDVFWHNTARYFMRHYGLDVAPEQYQYLAKSYFVGPMKLVQAALDSTFSLTDPDYPRKGGSNPSAADEMGPWLSALGGSMLYGKVRNNSQTMYFDYKRQVEDKIKRLGLKVTSKDNMGKPEKARAYREKVLADSGEFTPEEIADYELMRDTDRTLTKLSSNFNSQYKDTWMRMEDADQLRDVFLNLDRDATTAYDYFLTNSTWGRERP